MTSADKTSGLRVAIVGAASLKGKELKEVLEDRLFPIRKLLLLDDNEAVGQLTEFEGEPTFVHAIEQEVFAECDVVFFASTTGEFTRAQWPKAAATPATLIDLSHGVLDMPETVMRLPFLERELPGLPRSGGRWFAVPHPGAAVLLAVWARLSAALRLRQVVANVFEPVSERGAAGLEELQEQTVRLLSFQGFPRTVFDAQVAFNLLVRYGAASRARLEESEDIIRRGIERCAPELAKRLALRVIQVPVFHAHCLSILVELEEGYDRSAVESALRGARVAVLTQDEAPAAAVEVAGRDDIVIGPVLRDRRCALSFWLWAAVDNLRLTARTAVEIAEDLAA
jgi:aspartate-semialdehyde dehydrogenase